ncbi:hypothetical protein VTH8203_00612 [Vibrio thalassae]|uniref:Uncharacterized protein n=1 Tax=Vibrio thalassae TaxID=1243014 RepID=A0A240EEQ2_9VIBR|nr:FimV/HubP family polar landmark protein [Vibrio thalassae]SNX47011.1 hypothetical protein VTH8203_00612 [Vibrio thalassae]
MHHFLKPLLVTLALAGATTSFSISADTIRLTGPNGEALAAPQFSQPIRNQAIADSDAPARYYGPTKVNETLWSIASRFKPVDATIQQTIYAFYQLNPAVFERNNIHKLVPNSELRIPSRTQINRVDLQEALAVLAAHKNKLNAPVSPVIDQTKKSVSPQPTAIKPVENEAAKVTPAASQSTSEPVSPAQTKPTLEQVNTADTKTIDAEPSVTSTQDLTQKLQQELTRSESELLSLEERNHQLRLMLSEVQNEVEVLKSEVSNEERIRTEVERQLSEEKRKQAEMARLAPSKLDTWLAKPWFVALLAVVPALFVGLLAMMVLRSRKQKAELANAQETNNTNSVTDVAAATASGAAAAVAADVLEDDNPFSDDLLAGIEEDSDKREEDQQLEDDIFADLDESDLDFNLDDDDDPFASIDDDGDLDIGFVDLDASNNGISVKDGEKALGLEEMERALNDVAVPDSDDDLDLNLSDTDSEHVSQQELDDLFAEFKGMSATKTNDSDWDESESTLDQEDMDELLAGDSFDLESDDDFNLDDLDIEADQGETTTSTSKRTNETVDNSDIDDLFAQFSQIETSPVAPQNTVPELTQDDEVALLDEMLDDDFELSGLDDSDLMLDEIVDADDSEATGDEFTPLRDLDMDDVALLADDDVTLDENNTDLLDELLFESALDDSTSESKHNVDLEPFGSDELIGSDIDLESELKDGESDVATSEPATASLHSPEPQQSTLQHEESDQAGDRAESQDSPQKSSMQEESEHDLDSVLDDELNLSEPESETATANDIESVEPTSNASITGEPDFHGAKEESTTPESLDDASLMAAESTNQASLKASVANTTTFDVDEFDFSPEIEGLAETELEPKDNVQEEKELAALVANEFGTPHDDDWLGEDESASPQTKPETSQLSQSEESDDDFVANALQSEYNEDNAFADAEGDAEDMLPPADSESAADYAMTDDELPEYSEADALADAISGQLPESQDSRFVDTDKQDIDAVVDDIELPTEQTPQAQSSDAERQPDRAVTQSEREPIEEFEFPDYTEEDALADSEQGELEPVSDTSFEDELDEAISLEDLPEYDESQAAADMEASTSDTKPSFATEKEMVGETLDHSEIDALANAFSMVDMSAIEQEGQLGELLQEGEQAFSNISPVDQTTADSAGMDLDMMLQDSPNQDGGEDWNGFSLTEEQRASIDHQIPDDEQEIWNHSQVGSLADANEEDWSSQDPVADFEDSGDKFMTIDELMAQVEGSSASDEEEELKLDVGLDEFPDVIGSITDVDVDSDSEAAGNLDLAKIYIEMNDFEGAVKLLEKALLDGSGTIQSEAKALLSKLSEYQ